MGNLLVQIEITPEILFQVSEVTRLLGQFEGHRTGVRGALKEKIFIQNVYANLALEGSTLSTEQVQRIRDGESVGAMVDEMAQAKAFLRAYGKTSDFSVQSMKDMLTAFLVMNEGLSLNPKNGTGEAGQSWNTHMKEALELLGVLFRYVQDERMIHPLLKASIFHFQMVQIQPFVRYSAAVARLWHRMLLADYHPVFAMVPLEFQLKQQQQQYLNTLQVENSRSSLQEFVRFSIYVAYDALFMLLDRMDDSIKNVNDRLAFAKLHFGGERITRKKYMDLFKSIGSATASRDLKAGLDAGLLEKRGAKARTTYAFIN
ncbi:MAG: Fic family protein [Deltaproteobacteria bacterium]|nr:Fic family protein [Deltaproteobacteria bacterium]MBN2674373.1 Fic family protein [Deltaproteobacteria bacterium]